jgi:glyoxylase-like metal-dependent hydrolase (beta-lactamase superfamily II)
LADPETNGAGRESAPEGGAASVATLPGTREILPGIFEFVDRSPSTYGGKGFLVTGPKYNLLVDTPAFTPRVVEAIRAAGGLRYVFLSHRDEIGELDRIHQAVGGAVIMHRSESHLVPCGTDLVFDVDFEVEPGVWAIYTPGHSPGSSCLLLHRGDLKVLFTGDHILRRRQDVPAPLRFPWTWDWPAQVASARRLLDLEFDYIVPSHARHLERGYFADARNLLAGALDDPAVTKDDSGS